MNQSFNYSFKSLKAYCESENFKGWDPYDGLNSKVFQNSPLKNFSLFRWVWIQLFKWNPVNLRKLLLVEKDFNPKALGLFLYSYCQLIKNRTLLNMLEIDEQEIITRLYYFTNKIIEISSKGFSGACWGYNFDWQNRVFFQPKNTPTVVATSFISDALFEAYEVTKNEKFLETALSSAKFILNDLNRHEDDTGIIFSYSPFDNSRVFNASLLGARLLARCYVYDNNQSFLDHSKSAVNYVINRQKEDGSWIYGENKVQNWVDSFHTGYNLECIYEYSKYSKDASYKNNFTKGLEYYLSNFFLADGKPKYYYNKIYPIDIHSPAQLIATLSKTNNLKKNINLAEKVLEWTIKNMQSEEGYFHYQINRFFSSKIPYMRWSQAWMFYSLSLYLVSENE